MNTDVLIIGGGIAGLEAASIINKLGHKIILIEKEKQLGGHVALWDKLFPDFKKADYVIEQIQANIDNNITIYLSTQVVTITKLNKTFICKLNNSNTIESKTILITTGYDIFDARLKEEYGYGIFPNVITSVELETLFKNNKPILTSHGRTPDRVGFIHCVGSRDRKINNIYCSKVCCVTAVKQAIELKQKLPFVEAYCFYMDLRMYGLNFEEIYNESQEKYGVTFIRGRLSETSETHDGKLIIKVEDTLLGRPLRMTMDLLILMVGMIRSEGTKFLISELNLDTNSSNFINPTDEHLLPNNTNVKGVFVAGTATSPKSISDTIADARSAAFFIHQYLLNN